MLILKFFIFSHQPAISIIEINVFCYKKPNFPDQVQISDPEMLIFGTFF